ncbi:MAG: FAD-dependent oxidoreductase [Phycisphaerae bacterium]|nr:FAD-dependent oxidoreductase [Phycisphaerae bacterium]
MLTLSDVRTVPTADEVDILVVGGGPAGVAAGFSASRMGMKTLIVEQFNCLGGVATAGGCSFGAFAQGRCGCTQSRSENPTSGTPPSGLYSRRE